MTTTSLLKPANYQHMVLARRPQTQMQLDDFEIQSLTFKALPEAQVLIKNHYLSIDPYMRGRMNQAKSYAAPQALGQTMIGATVGQVVESNSPEFPVGCWVSGMGGWSEYSYLPVAGLRLLDVSKVAPSAYLGVAGMPGMTAWYGLKQILQARAGQTLVVTAAAGAVGSVVGQLAKRAGCRVIGIAGGEQKTTYLRQQLGFDVALDYKAENFKSAYNSAAEQGIDLVFENVGGAVFDQTLSLLNPFARIALCGMIASYDGQHYAYSNLSALLSMRAHLQGFIISEHLEYWPQGLRELSELVANGELHYQESISQGLTSAPAALLGVLNGKNFGKQVVQL